MTRAFSLRRPPSPRPAARLHTVIELGRPGPGRMVHLDDEAYLDLLAAESRSRRAEVLAGIWDPGHRPYRNQDDIALEMEVRAMAATGKYERERRRRP